MSSGIRIDGLDELQRILKDMEQGLTFETVDFWCKRIVNDVKINFPEYGERLEMEAIRDADGKIAIQFGSPRALIRPVAEITRRYLQEMSVTTRAIFEKFAEIVEAKETE